MPAEVIRACVRYGIPLIAVPAETSFAAVTEEVGRRLGGDRATAMTRVLGRRRLLLSAVAVAEVDVPGAAGGRYSLFGVGGKPRITSWFLACAGREQVTSDEVASHELLLAAVPPSVHVNTVRYRIRRIEELTGRDLSRLSDQVDFVLALQVR